MTTAPLFSRHWYQVRGLRPRLRPHARIHRQVFRDRVWYVLQDHATGRFHRFDPAAYAMIGLMDGRRTLEEIWSAAADRLGGAVPTQDDVIRLLGQLHKADALVSDLPPSVEEIARRGERQARRSRWQSLRNPLFVRIPLVDPDRFLAATCALVRPLFTVWGLLAWALLVLWAGSEAAVHWEALTDNLADRVLATENLIILLVTFPLVKLLHELGHGYAVKSADGEVHEIGVMLLVFMPVPYVEASSASAFRDKWRRFFVGAAGMMVELALAAAAMQVWLAAEPGLVRAAAFNVMLIAGVSTLIFNGNPLLRFDGYYMLCDAIEVPNLATRANRYYYYLFQRYVAGLREQLSPAQDSGERLWFLFYAPASLAYRVVVMIGIAVFIAQAFFFVGVLLAVWSAIQMFVIPLGKGAGFLFASPRLSGRRRRALVATGGFAAAVTAALFLLPLPHGTVAEGVVWAPQRGRITAGVDGIVADVVVPSGTRVAAGEGLFRLDDPLLEAELRLLDATVEVLDRRLAAAEGLRPAEARILRQELASARHRQAYLRDRVAELTVRSPLDGVFLLQRPAGDLRGRYVSRGTPLGYVVEDATPVVRVAVQQSDVDWIRQSTRRVDVRFEQVPGTIIAGAAIERLVPTATRKLPSPALAAAVGGPLELDPTDPERRTALQPFFEVDVRVPVEPAMRTIGDRAFVRFDHGATPVAARLYRALRREFLGAFGV